jgi:hypothetical protein
MVNDFSALRNVQAASSAHPSSYSVVTGVSFLGQGVNLTAHLYPVPRLIICGTIPLCPHMLSVVQREGLPLDFTPFMQYPYLVIKTYSLTHTKNSLN